MLGQDNSGAVAFGFSLKRIRRWSYTLGAIGAAVAISVGGLGAAASFLVGALASFFNLQLLHAIVAQLGPEPVPGSRQIIWISMLRYVALGLLGYATVKVFGVDPVPFCIGLLVATIALLLDSLTELLYARA